MSELFRIKGKAHYFDPAIRGSYDGKRYECKLTSISEEDVALLESHGVIVADGAVPNTAGTKYPEMGRWLSLKSERPFKIKDSKKNDFPVGDVGIGNGTDLLVVCGTYPDKMKKDKFYASAKVIQVLSLVEFGGSNVDDLLEETDGYEASPGQIAKAATEAQAKDLLDDEIPL